MLIISKASTGGNILVDQMFAGTGESFARLFSKKYCNLLKKGGGG